MKQREDKADMRTEREQHRHCYGFPGYINYLTIALVKCKKDIISAVLRCFGNYCITPKNNKIITLYHNI